MTEYQKYVQRYFDLVPSSNWIEEMKISGDKTAAVFHSLNDSQANFAYADGKWTLKEVLQHLIDAEKIFAYRALRFARKDKTPLPGWDEEEYGRTYTVRDRAVESLAKNLNA